MKSHHQEQREQQQHSDDYNDGLQHQQPRTLLSVPSSNTGQKLPPKCYATTTNSIIKNFRQVAGINSNIYRCGSIDGLANIDSSSCSCSNIDQFVFTNVGLIIDLRSSNERNEQMSQKWISNASSSQSNETKSKTSFIILNDDHKHQRFARIMTKQPILQKQQQQPQEQQQRYVVRIDILSSKSKFMSYIQQNWLPSFEKQQQKQQQQVENRALLIDKLNQRGLFGLNEIILEISKNELCYTLQVITLYFETKSSTNQSLHSISPATVVFHCVQGKDRYVITKKYIYIYIYMYL